MAFGGEKTVRISTPSLEYLIALKTNPDSRAFLDAYDTGKKKLVRTGELKRLRNKWLDN
ncbi:MAG: hypothetical protein GY737_06305 [Desulfobacteraceae bacterium]|nr:hypothetical protein [Desulfobacteraceae bacterium]